MTRKPINDMKCNAHSPSGQNDGDTTAAVKADADAITRALQQSFQATVEESVPDSLMDLINQLK